MGTARPEFDSDLRSFVVPETRYVVIIDPRTMVS